MSLQLIAEGCPSNKTTFSYFKKTLFRSRKTNENVFSLNSDTNRNLSSEILVL